ncbi:prepilin peptidase [Candidatus Curtissbacteria bacterium]|nr:prepilin peptidase [Candidatus Curtissbacteria bacterium]
MILFLITSFILGSAVGSFLNVVIDRTTRRESILGRSYCNHCRATLATVDLIPIVSFVALGASCRYCRKPLSWQYPAVEATTALLFALSIWMLSLQGQLGVFSLLYYFFLISILIIVAIVDLKFSLIPTTFILAASLVSLFYNYFTLPSPAFVDHVFAAFLLAIFFGAIVLATRGRGMGEGDVFLAFLIGMVLGIGDSAVAVFLGFLIGAVVSVFLIILGKKRFGQTVPFAPFLVLGFLISLFWAQEILAWYLMVY